MERRTDSVIHIYPLTLNMERRTDSVIHIYPLTLLVEGINIVNLQICSNRIISSCILDIGESCL